VQFSMPPFVILKVGVKINEALVKWVLFSNPFI